MKKKLYIHIGAHKCASTTIQKNLAANEEILAEQGVRVFLKKDIFPSTLDQLFKKIARNDFADDAEYQSLADASKADMNNILSDLGGEERALISYEGFLGGSYLDRSESLYPNSGKALEAIREITADYDVKIIFLVRQQPGFIESCYLQQVKEWRGIKFGEYLRRIDLYQMSWLKIAEQIENIFGRDNMLIYPFEEIKKGTEPYLRKILSYVVEGEFGADIHIRERSNSSLTKEGVKEIYRINEKIVRAGLSPEEAQKVRNENKKRIFNMKGRRAEYMNKFVADKIIEHYSEDNKKLFERYIKELSADYYDQKTS